MSRILYIIAFSIICQGVFAQSGYSISVVTENYDNDEIYLGYYFAKGQYVRDTAKLEDGKYLFQGEDSLAAGFYMIVFPPNNEFFQVLIGEEDTNIEIQADGNALSQPVAISGSEDTRLFYEYAEFIASKRTISDTLRAEAIELKEGSPRFIEIEEELKVLNQVVLDQQEIILTEHSTSLTALLIRANLEIDIPEFGGTEEEVQQKRYRYFKDHYFDHIDFLDERIVRSSFLHDKIAYYTDKLTIQQPDSIIASIQTVLEQMDKDEDVFQAYLVFFLNKYAQSKIVGMDAIYVFLVETYYKTGLAQWSDEDQVAKIIKNSNTLKPILLGKVAPDLMLQGREKEPITLHGIDSKYTVLFFWDPECGHCKKSIPGLIEFYENYKAQGIEILGICTKLQEDCKECWEAIDKRGMDVWINACDPNLKSRFKQIYDIRVTPQIFVLDSNKVIKMKKIGAEQLPGVLDFLLEKPAD